MLLSLADDLPMDNWVTSFGPFCVTRSRRLLERDGEPVQIGSRAFDILTHLLDNPGQVVSHRALLEAAWPGATVEEGNLRFQIAALRKVLGSSETRYVINVPGRGYCFVAPIAQREEVEPRPTPLREPSERHVPPSPPTSLIGRDDAIAEISNLVPAHRIVSIVAPGGMGKTALAIAVAHRFDGILRDRVCFVELAPYDEARGVVDSLASALGISAGSEDLIGDIVSMLKSRQMLIVFDSCEHVIGSAAALIENIVAETTNVQILVTSREALRIDFERVFQLEALASPPDNGAQSIAEILSYPAAQLFLERAGVASNYFSSDRQAQLVARICRRLDGLPLAIEIAASRTQAFDLERLEHALEDGRSLTWSGERAGPSRHQTLGAMMDWSYSLLPENEKGALRLLAMFSGSFSLEDAIALVSMGTAGIDTPWALNELVSKSLVSVTSSGEGMKYRLLDTTRTYARQKLNEAGELEAAQHRLATLYQRALENQYSANVIPHTKKLGPDKLEETRDAKASAAISPFGAETFCNLGHLCTSAKG
jgi:predicted ATPase/DNA-binding winged helix-turn-helix (wHTH) protein